MLSRSKMVQSSQHSYNRTEKRWKRRRGFRLTTPRRFSVCRLRVRFLCFVKLLNRLKCSYGQAMNSLKKGVRSCRSCTSKGRMEPMEEQSLTLSDCSLRTYMRSNSFYSEAIADCLEFIKRSSASVDDNPVVIRRWEN